MGKILQQGKITSKNPADLIFIYFNKKFYRLIQKNSAEFFHVVWKICKWCIIFSIH